MVYYDNVMIQLATVTVKVMTMKIRSVHPIQVVANEQNDTPNVVRGRGRTWSLMIYRMLYEGVVADGCAIESGIG